MAGIPELNEILREPEVLAAMQDPEVMVDFQDVAQNPAKMPNYQRHPKVMNLISKLSAKFASLTNKAPTEEKATLITQWMKFIQMMFSY